MLEILALLALLGLLIFFYRSLRSKEIASDYGRRYCLRHGLQFLDETVALNRFGVRRNEYGRLGLIRYYRFEFSSDGSRRYGGSLEVHGNRVANIQLQPYIEQQIPKNGHTIDSVTSSYSAIDGDAASDKNAAQDEQHGEQQPPTAPR